MTNTQLLARLFSSPRRFFDDLAQSPRFALPMWLIVFVTVAIVFWFYSVADIAQMIDQQLAANPRSAQMTEQQRETAAKFMTRGILTWTSVIAVILITFGSKLLEALYYRIAGRATGFARTYRQWFAFAWWTSVPGLIAAIPTLVILLLTPAAQLEPSALQPLSINSLFLHLEPKDSGYQLAQNLQVVMVLTLGLAVYGVRCWSKRSWLYSAVFALLPIAVIGGITALAMMAAHR
jgi:hypothetical protein